MSYVKCLRGIGSGAIYPPETIMNLCPVDGRPVEMVLDLERLGAEKPNAAWYHPERQDMWRFGALLPLDIDDPADRAHIVTLGEGCTPLLDYGDYPTAKKAGFALEIKDEGAPGHNPTASFKDRGMAITVSMAKKLGLHRLAIPTQGNAGDALTAYGLAAGFEIAVVMPDDTDAPILNNVLAASQKHAQVHFDVVRGTIREAGKLAREKYFSDGYFNVSTFQEPGWRIEGKKTMGLELAEPRHSSAPWQLPDVILYPTGGGTGILGMWKAFNELEALGLIGAHRPRMVSVQSTSTPPIANAFNKGAADVEPVEPGQTLATGLNVAGGVGHFRVLGIIYESQGSAVAVSEEAITDALCEVVQTKGWDISPEGAACLAALEPLVEREVIRPGDRVIAFNTASLKKYWPSVEHLFEKA